MGAKADARLERALAKKADFERKKARQASEFDVKKRIGSAEKPTPTKTAKEEPLSVGQRRMEWSRDNADIVGEWSWGSRSCLVDDWDVKLHPFLLEYEKKTWNQISAECTGKKKRRPKHIDYTTTSICKEARDRLVELEFDDVDRIFRFRLSGKERLYGINRLHIFMVLWWDPEHNVYPVD